MRFVALISLLLVATRSPIEGADQRVSRGGFVATAGRSGRIVGYIGIAAPAPVIYTVYLPLVEVSNVR
jgi:hypothetical protein